MSNRSRRPFYLVCREKQVTVTTAEVRAKNDSIKSASVILCVASRILPTIKGLTKPARLPTELIQAMPTEAAVPERIPVGIDQKVE